METSKEIGNSRLAGDVHTLSLPQYISLFFVDRSHQGPSLGRYYENANKDAGLT